MQARYYDPVIGRFYSNDPVDVLGHMSGTQGVQGFNRYAYVNNNPYKYTDPTGMCASINDEKVRTNCETKRADATEAAKTSLESASVKSGSKEAAFIATFNENTQEVTIRTGDNAANRDNSSVQFTNENGGPLEVDAGSDGRISGTSDIVLVTGHSHPKADRSLGFKDRSAINRANENIGNNPIDQVLSQIAPAVIKTPSGKIKVFRNGKEVK